MMHMIPYASGVHVVTMNGREVNSDTFEYLLHTIPYVEGGRVTIGTDNGDYTLPVVRFKDNAHGII